MDERNRELYRNTRNEKNEGQRESSWDAQITIITQKKGEEDVL